MLDSVVHDLEMALAFGKDCNAQGCEREIRRGLSKLGTRILAPASFVLPDYGGACIASVAPALLGRFKAGDRAKVNYSSDGSDIVNSSIRPSWLPETAFAARQVVLLVIDGLGWDQLVAHRSDAPALADMVGGSITSVAPTTTATALTSIATGRMPSEHGVVGYRIQVGHGDVLNVLRWTTSNGDARTSVLPGTIQTGPSFCGINVPVVSRIEFAGTGFTDAHLPGTRLAGWRVASSIAVEVQRLLAANETFIYAYYDGIDKVAHEKGIGEHYQAELRTADRLVGDLISILPRDACLVVTADHGQVEVPDPPIQIPAEVLKHVTLLSGEGRFRWLHVRPGKSDDVAAACADLYSHLAVVATRDELEQAGVFGGELSPRVADRLGDVALVATAPVAFYDKHDTGEMQLVARHGALTASEMLVPLLAARR